MKGKAILIFYAIILGVGALQSCSSSMSDREKSAFSTAANGYIVDIENINTIAKLDSFFYESHCNKEFGKWPMILFDYSKKEITSKENANTVALSVEPPPCPHIDFVYDFDRILEIEVEGNNVKIEGKLLPLDSIPSYIYLQYLNYGKAKGYSKMPLGNGIWIIGDMNRPISDFNPVIEKVVDGYLLTINAFSDAIIDKKVADLNDDEIEILKKKILFNLGFRFSNEIKPIIQLGN